MVAVIQRVLESSVTIDGEVVSKISKGRNILLGVSCDDTEDDLCYIAKKIPLMRIFEDNEGKLNRSILDTEGEILVISQFTLLANCQKGNRPSFIQAGRPEMAVPIYEKFVDMMRASGIKTVKTGVFGADMKVQILNDGPVTIILNSKEK